jgi:hypothetical protein
VCEHADVTARIAAKRKTSRTGFNVASRTVWWIAGIAAMTFLLVVVVTR